MLGFLVGAAFWHAVGFWVFVREVAFKDADFEPRAVAQSGAACSELVLDRASRRVHHTACPENAPDLAEVAGDGKADFAGAQRMSARKRWSVTVLAEPEPADDDDAN